MNNKDQTTPSLPWRERLAFQLGVPFFIFVIFVFALITAGSLISLEYDAVQINQLPRRLVQTASNEVGLFFGNLQSTLTVVAKSSNANLTFTPAETQYFRNVLVENPSILELVFLTASGTPKARFASPTIPEVIEANAQTADDDIVVDDLNKIHLSIPTRSIYGTSISHWTIPLKDQNGVSIGSFRATIDLSSLWSILSKYREGGVATLYLADNEGTLIVANTKLQDSVYDEAHKAQIRDVFSHPSEPRKYTGIEGAEVVGLWAPVPPTDWLLVAEAPTAAFSQNSGRTVASIYAIFAGMLMFLLYELYIVRQVLLMPLRTLRSAVKSLAEGNYQTRAEVTVDNELKAFADVLNTMAENVDKSTSNIVEKLRELLVEQDRSSKMLVRRDLELVRANEKLRKLDEAKSQFVSVAAHQLRTPLSAVKWAVHMLLGGDLGTLAVGQKEVLLKAAQSNDRMIKLVNDLLNVDHIESGKSEYIYVPLIVTDLISSVLAELKPIAEQRGVVLQFDAGSKRFSPVLADRDKLRGVFQNLIDNAIKYTLVGGSARVSITEDDTSIKVAISDTGIGIPAADQSKIFSKFFRSKNAVKIATEGTGLGLFIVREIINQHGGKIWFESIEGTGTTFHIMLPKVSPDARRPVA